MRLHSRFIELMKQFTLLLNRATLVPRETTYEIGEDTFTDTWSEYEFEDPGEWSAFVVKWHVPHGAAHALLRSLRKIVVSSLSGFLDQHL